MISAAISNGNFKWLLLLGLLTAIVFSNSLNGEFVYDDKRQILRNPLIQRSDLYLQALKSDVWAFKGDGTISASNYWRPTFTAWVILNYLIFGPDAFGWHFGNLLLHLIVTILVFIFLNRLGMERITAFFVTLLFAIHPVHTESVTWISGSPDLLFATFLLLSLLLALRFAEENRKIDYWASVVIFLPALGAKEVALFSIPLFYLILKRGKLDSTAPHQGSIVPYVIAGIAYFLTRWIVLGSVQTAAPGAVQGLGTVLLSAPPILLFYIKQAVLPIALGANYPLKPIDSFSMQALIAGLTAIFALALLWLGSRRSRIQSLGLAFFILPLIPVFNVGAFNPEHIVHDRYLYLPVLGMILLLVPQLLDIAVRLKGSQGKRFAFGVLALIAVAFGVKTYRYNEVWLDDLSLWRHSVTIDPTSASSFSQLGSILAERGMTDQSISAYNRSLDLHSSPLAYLGRGRNFAKKGMFEQAIRDLNSVAEMSVGDVDAYSLYQIYEALAVSYQGKNDLRLAESVLRNAREKLPIYKAALTSKLAVILYLQGEKNEALQELESVRKLSRSELLPESKSAVYRLGILYYELGRKDRAIEALSEYLQITNGIYDKNTNIFRRDASRVINKLS